MENLKSFSAPAAALALALIAPSALSEEADTHAQAPDELAALVEREIANCMAHSENYENGDEHCAQYAADLDLIVQGERVSAIVDFASR